MKKIVSMALVFVMLFVFSSVSFAQEAGGNTGNFVLMEKEVEDCGDFVIEKTLEIEQSRARIGFGGTKTARVTHTYNKKSGGEYLGSITAMAEFKSSPNSNTVYVDYYDVSYDGDYVTFAPKEKVDNNQGAGTKYAKYTVTYTVRVTGGLVPNSGTASMWVKCTASAVTSNSGNKTYNRAP